MTESSRISAPSENETELEYGYEQLAVLQLSEVQGALPRCQGSSWAKVRWGEISCRLCSKPLPSREGAYVLKYFLLHKIGPRQKYGLG